MHNVYSVALSELMNSPLEVPLSADYLHLVPNCLLLHYRLQECMDRMAVRDHVAWP